MAQKDFSFTAYDNAICFANAFRLLNSKSNIHIPLLQCFLKKLCYNYNTTMMDGEDMFQPNDYVVYGRSGVCVVEGTEQIRGQDFYCLRSLYQDCHIKTPVNGKNPIRPVISKDEANALIDRIPLMEKRTMNASNTRDLSEIYRASILSQECAELVELTMTIYAKKQEAQRAKKKLSTTDQAFLKEGEGLLFGELSVALGIPFDEVQPYIKNRLKSNEQNSR